jgi:hypothetical protein
MPHELWKLKLDYLFFFQQLEEICSCGGGNGAESCKNEMGTAVLLASCISLLNFLSAS